MHYADARRDSIVLVPDFTGPMPTGVSDVQHVLGPTYESIKNVCHDAVREPNEAVVVACIHELGRMAAFAMAIVHTQQGAWKTAPLSHSPVFYLKVCTEEASKAKMDDALLTSVRAIGPIFAKISDQVRTLDAEVTAIDCLFDVALASYGRQANVPADEAVKMMIAIARHELKVRDFQHNHSLRAILNNLAILVPFEVALEKAGLRIAQVFAPYGFTGLRTLLIEESEKIKVDDRSWVDPFHDFNELSEALVHHYRHVAEKVRFDGALLEKWIVESALDCADVHLHLIGEPPKGSERYLENVENRLIWFIHAPCFFFEENTSFPYQHAEDAAGRLAILGMRLLRLGRLDAAKECAKALACIGKQSAGSKNSKAYLVADIFIKLEVLARAAHALGHASVARECRALERRDEITAVVPNYANAIENRIRHLDKSSAAHRSAYDLSLPDDPLPLLHRILYEAKELKVQRKALLDLLRNRYRQS
jgi:hypothetical protein